MTAITGTDDKVHFLGLQQLSALHMSLLTILPARWPQLSIPFPAKERDPPPLPDTESCCTQGTRTQASGCPGFSDGAKEEGPAAAEALKGDCEL